MREKELWNMHAKTEIISLSSDSVSFYSSVSRSWSSRSLWGFFSKGIFSQFFCSLMSLMSSAKNTREWKSFCSFWISLENGCEVTLCFIITQSQQTFTLPLELLQLLVEIAWELYSTHVDRCDPQKCQHEWRVRQIEIWASHHFFCGLWRVVVWKLTPATLGLLAALRLAVPLIAHHPRLPSAYVNKNCMEEKNKQRKKDKKR